MRTLLGEKDVKAAQCGMNKAQAMPKAMTAPTKDEIRTRKTRPLTTPLRDSVGVSSRCIGEASVVVQGGLSSGERRAMPAVAGICPAFSRCPFHLPAQP